MLELRASQIDEFVKDPMTYYQPAKEQTEAMKLGTEREPLSYMLFAQALKDKNTPAIIRADVHYNQQVYGTMDFDGIKITGHADIVGKDYIVDIKNSTRNDQQLQEAYWYQLNAYGNIFGIKTLYLFVDQNNEGDMDIKKCHFVKIDFDEAKFSSNIAIASKYLKQATEECKELWDGKKIDECLSEIRVLQTELDDLQNTIDAKKKELMEHLSAQHVYSYKNDDYTVSNIMKQEIKYKRETISATWTGKYTHYIMLKPNKKGE